MAALAGVPASASRVGVPASAGRAGVPASAGRPSERGPRAQVRKMLGVLSPLRITLPPSPRFEEKGQWDEELHVSHHEHP